jgi:hypothetical protein
MTAGPLSDNLVTLRFLPIDIDYIEERNYGTLHQGGLDAHKTQPAQDSQRRRAGEYDRDQFHVDVTVCRSSDTTSG